MIKILIKSSESTGFAWKSHNNVFVRGYAYVEEKYLNAAELIPLFSGVKEENDLKNIIIELNGIFAVIIVKKDRVFAAVDRYGVFKLFYSMDNSYIYIGDDTDGIAKASGCKTVNKEAVKDWCYSGFVAKHDTLIEGVFSINASEYLSFTDFSKNPKVEKYHVFSLFPDNEKKYSEFLEVLSHKVKRAADRLVESLGGKRALIPLSGGVDSRFCAMLLKMTGYEKVTCFSYGNKNGKEEKIARATARELGFEHIFIPYRYHDWFSLFKTDENIKYIDSFSQYKATTHFSDLFAARFLAGEYDPKACVIVPGHIGSIAESIFDNNREYSSQDIAEKFITKYFYFYGSSHDSSMKYLHNRLDGYAPNKISADAAGAQGIFDDAAYDTYRSNHLFMALRPYEFYGFEWRIPLMDREVVEFFKSVPVDYKGKTKTMLCDFVNANCCDTVQFYKEPQNYLQKVLRNIGDKRYSCINPFIVHKLKPEWDTMPSFIKVIYRFYRNYLSYASLKTLKHLIKKIEEIK